MVALVSDKASRILFGSRCFQTQQKKSILKFFIDKQNTNIPKIAVYACKFTKIDIKTTIGRLQEQDTKRQIYMYERWKDAKSTMTPKVQRYQ